MTPSADDFAKKINRDIRAGDILIERWTRDMGATEFCEYWEVINPNVEGHQKKLLGFIGGAVKPCVEVREMTLFGPVEETRLFSRDDERWSDIIRSENRIEGSNFSLRER
jgi:hypothetical protein